MSIAAPTMPLPTQPPDDALWPISVEQYHQMLDAGIFDEDSPVELLEGCLVAKMPKHTPHKIVTQKSGDWFHGALPKSYHVIRQDPVILETSEPEADVSVIRGRLDDFLAGHPRASEVALIVEVSDSTLRRDRGWKKRIYAKANIPQYWIINLVDHQIEVYYDPNPEAGDYRQPMVYGPKDEISVTIDGVVIGTLRLEELLPRE